MKTITMSDCDYDILLNKLPLVLRHTKRNINGSETEMMNITRRLIIIANKLNKKYNKQQI